MEEINYYGYVYCILDQKYNKVYIGQKKGSIEKTKNYYGSGAIIKKKIKSRGLYFFKKIILGVCYSKEELQECETECKLFFHALNPLYGYNIILQDMNLADAIKNHPDKEDIYKKRTKTRMSWYKHSEETKKKLSASHLGIEHTEESKKKISESGKGRDPWNKGLTKETSDSCRKISESRKGMIFSEEHLQHMSESRKGCKSPMEGKNHTEESKQKMSKSKKGKPILKLRGRQLSEETKYKCGNGNRNRIQPLEEKNKRALSNTKLKNKEDLILLIDLFFDKQSTKEIAEIFKVNAVTIRKKLKQLGLPLYVNKDCQERKDWFNTNRKEEFYDKIPK